MAGGTYFAARLPEHPLDAAAEFYAQIVPLVRADFETFPAFNVTIVFDTAGHEHRSWRLAVIQELAREVAPEGRVNGVVAEGAEVPTALQTGSLSETIAWLQGAPGITGQLLAVD
jgi:short chain dehydrogenase-like protein